MNWDAWPIIQATNMFNDPPPAGWKDVLLNLNGQFVGSGSASIIDWEILFGYVGLRGIEYKTFVQSCGVVPSPSQLDYSNFYTGARFSINECVQVPQDDLSTLELRLYDFDTNSEGWFALR